jgi:hypothetical protein
MTTNNTTPVETLFEKIENYGNTTIKLFHSNVIDTSAEVVSSLALQFVIFMVVVFFTLMLNIGLAFWIGELLGKTYYGFFIIGGAYMLLASSLLLLGHKWIKTPISNIMITQMSKKKIV